MEGAPVTVQQDVTLDVELSALATCVRALKPLSEDTRRRILDYLNARWLIPNEKGETRG